MLLGKVKWFDNNKGYGFILPLDEKEKDSGEVFVHHERIKKNGFKTLKENQLISYTKKETVNGIMAEIVIPIESTVTEAMESIIVDFCKEFFMESSDENLNKLIYGMVQIFIYRKMKDSSLKITKSVIVENISWDEINNILEDKTYPFKVKKGLEIYVNDIDFNEEVHENIIKNLKN